MKNSAIVIKWNMVIKGYNAKPQGISVHKDERAAYAFLREKSYKAGTQFWVPDSRMALIEVPEKTPLKNVFSRQNSQYYPEGADDFAYRQAKAMVPFEYRRIDYDQFLDGGRTQAETLAHSHEALYRQAGYRSDANWGVFAL